MGEVNSTQINEVIDQWIIGRNAERNREIAKRRFVDGIKFESLADEFCLSVRQTKNIAYKCKETIIEHLP